MIILQGKDISVNFGERVLFSDVNFSVDENDKIGLAGANGAGKTTLFKMLSGQEPEDWQGQITKQAGLSVGFMEQHVLRNDDITVYEEALSVFAPLIEKEREIEQLHDRIDSGEVNDELLEKQMRLTEEFQRDGGLTCRSRTESMLAGMGFPAETLSKPVSVLSGGERSKLQLVKLLLSGAKLLLLDEPTSGLDPVVRDEVVEMLMDFTREETHAILISSHIVSDLEKLCDYVAFLHKGKLLLCEEKDRLLAEYGLLYCTQEELGSLPPEAVKYKKKNPYGMQALVLRDALPDGVNASPVSIEELFVFMAKEAE